VALSTRKAACFLGPAALLLLASAASAGTRSDTSSRPGGWIEAARGSVDKASWISELTSTLRVPSAPRYGGQVLYLFSALQPAAGSNVGKIIQPVLQYDSEGWSIASFSVEDGEATHSAFVRTAPGHTISGSMKGSACNAQGVCTWTITTSDRTSGETTTLTVHDTVAYGRYYAGVVEAYGITSCSEYPGDGFVRFEHVTVRDQNGELLEAAPELWVDDEVAPQCGFGARAPAQDAVSLFFDRGCPAGC